MTIQFLFHEHENSLFSTSIYILCKVIKLTFETYKVETEVYKWRIVMSVY
ncbi:hypothetical protein HanRHA438_Chr04g0181211 [Helianthus annuus]|nr:hypothetical protein HanIR_Chr13g0629281 [Helianthus annuus]KAJ0857340.1 hypothetical protein HanRHA438_Chr13g0588961 [Helianthus annuus]KAJ0927297.1 hypothetical protein HanRHA438_Chr04g0181211 [Helianthus annuus]